MYLFTYGSEFNFKMMASYSHAIKIWFLNFHAASLWQHLTELRARGLINAVPGGGNIKIFTSEVGCAYCAATSETNTVIKAE